MKILSHKKIDFQPSLSSPDFVRRNYSVVNRVDFFSFFFHILLKTILESSKNDILRAQFICVCRTRPIWGGELCKTFLQSRKRKRF